MSFIKPFIFFARPKKMKQKKGRPSTLAFGFLRLCYCLRRFQELATAQTGLDPFSAVNSNAQLC